MRWIIFSAICTWNRTLKTYAISAGLALTVPVSADLSAETLKLAITSSYEPFFTVEKGTPRGLLYDVVNAIAKKHGQNVTLTVAPRKRHETGTASGDYDGFLNSLEWTSHVNTFIHSDIIVVVRDVIFSLEKSPLTFSNLSDLDHKHLIGIRGYRYPMLDQQFASKKSERIDTQDELAALKMLDLGRADGAIIVDSVGNWLIKNGTFKNKFVRSEKDITNSGLRLILNKKWQPFLTIFNKELQAMKTDGTLAAIQETYLGKP